MNVKVKVKEDGFRIWDLGLGIWDLKSGRRKAESGKMGRIGRMKMKRGYRSS